MSVAQRSALMSRIRGSGTKPEREVAAILDALGRSYETQARDLPGRPDFVMRELRIAVLVDGDFWHGRHFVRWRDKLAPFWREKIAANIRRDARNRTALRAAGWTVVRIWEHQTRRSRANVRRRLATRIRRAEKASRS